MKREGSPIKILFLDKEGGFGGSSRSLYFLIRRLDRTRIKPYVVLREAGPTLAKYADIKVRAIVRKKMPILKPSPRNNLYVLLSFLMQFPRFISSYCFLRRMVAAHGINIIHMNHDSFFVYGLIRYVARTKIVFHMRTLLPINSLARLQARCISLLADHLIFISENELKRFTILSGRVPKGASVIFNIAEPLLERSSGSAFPNLPKDTFKVLYLGNLTYNKGVDRLVEIAKELKARAIDNVWFVVCGENREHRLGKRDGITVEDYAAKEGVRGFFCFMGHQVNPDLFLENTDLLIRPSRGNDPWGRDIIEALAWGKPVVAIGTYSSFVEDGVNGYLHEEYDAKKIAENIVYLSKHPEVTQKMRTANLEKAQRFFDGRKNAARVVRIYESLMSRK